MSLNLVMSETSSERKIAGQAIREELSRMLESPIFAQSERLSRFLRFTVEATLAGNGDALKEYLIGTEVYDRKPPYHPSADSIVRSEARRLRIKLKQYYESLGKDDPVFIHYRPGSYVPAFRTQPRRDRESNVTERALGKLVGEELVAQVLKLTSEDQKLGVQIVFEGTLRVLRSATASAESNNTRSGQALAHGDQTPKVISMSLKKSAEVPFHPNK